MANGRSIFAADSLHRPVDLFACQNHASECDSFDRYARLARSSMITILAALSTSSIFHLSSCRTLRSDLHPPSRPCAEFGEPAGFPALLDEYRISATLLAPSTPAVALLDRLPEWQRVYAGRYSGRTPATRWTAVSLKTEELIIAFGCRRGRRFRIQSYRSAVAIGAIPRSGRASWIFKASSF
jgi:hypothetical protein